jgi:hypothetical protein
MLLRSSGLPPHHEKSFSVCHYPVQTVANSQITLTMRGIRELLGIWLKR